MRPQRWQRRKDERAPEILGAALTCFAEKGFAATRMDDIARRAGITKGTIYLYFESKEAVFQALARQEVAERIAEITAMVVAFEGPTPDLLRMVLTAGGTMARTSDAAVLPKVLMAESGTFPELAEFWRREIIDPGLGVFARIIARGQARGEFRDMSPQHGARLCVAPMMIIMFWRTVFGKFDDQPYDYQGLVDAHIETLLRGLSAENPKP